MYVTHQSKFLWEVVWNTHWRRLDQPIPPQRTRQSRLTSTKISIAVAGLFSPPKKSHRVRTARFFSESVMGNVNPAGVRYILFSCFLFFQHQVYHISQICLDSQYWILKDGSNEWSWLLLFSLIIFTGSMNLACRENYLKFRNMAKWEGRRNTSRYII